MCSSVTSIIARLRVHTRLACTETGFFSKPKCKIPLSSSVGASALTQQTRACYFVWCPNRFPGCKEYEDILSDFAADIFSQLTCRFHASKSASGAYAAFFKAPNLQPPTPKPPTSNSKIPAHKRCIEPKRQSFKFHTSNLAKSAIRDGLRTSGAYAALLRTPKLQPPTQKPILKFQKLFLE